MANNHLESKWNESGVFFQEIHTSYLIRNNVSSKFKLRRRRFAIHLKHYLIYAFIPTVEEKSFGNKKVRISRSL